jgi:hypothetical protein
MAAPLVCDVTGVTSGREARVPFVGGAAPKIAGNWGGAAPHAAEIVCTSLRGVCSGADTESLSTWLTQTVKASTTRSASMSAAFVAFERHVEPRPHVSVERYRYAGASSDVTSKRIRAFE